MTQDQKKNMTHIGSILGRSLMSCRSGGDAEMMKIWDIWNDAVGESIAKNSRPASFKGHLLVVHVSSSSWLYHLNFMKKDLMDKLNKALGSDRVRELSFKIGRS